MTFSLDFDGENKPMSLYSEMELDFFFFFFLHWIFFFFFTLKEFLEDLHTLLEIKKKKRGLD